MTFVSRCLAVGALLAMAPGCEQQGDGHSSGTGNGRADLSANCETSSETVDRSSTTPIGVVPSQYFAMVEGTGTYAIESNNESWDGKSVELGFGDMGEARFVTAVGPDGMMGAGCQDFLEQDLELQLDTADGSFAERIPVVAEVRDDGAGTLRAEVSASIPFEELTGSFQIAEFNESLSEFDYLDVHIVMARGVVTSLQLSAHADEENSTSAAIGAWYANP